MTVVALGEARSRGFAIDDALLTDALAWTKQRLVPAPEATPRLTDGLEIPSLAIPLLTLALATMPDALTPDEIDRSTKYVIDRQQPDGGWILQPRNPHPVFDSRETLTTWFYLGLEAGLPKGAEVPSAARTGRALAEKWLSARPAVNTTQYWVLQLLTGVRAQVAPREQQRAVDELLRRQNPDGGWGQTPTLGSDAYATGQALYVLSLAGVADSRNEIRRGVDFLVTTQREDGSWKMVPRETPERKASQNLVPITYFGAAWGTIGLVRSIPKPDPP
jgi:hypothetical protein